MDMDTDTDTDSKDMGTVDMDKDGNKDKETELQVLPAEKSDGRIFGNVVFHMAAADFAVPAAAVLIAAGPFEDFLVHQQASYPVEQAYKHFSCLGQ
jgi:hypothetical protein